mmetsp:Transcript_8018/g.23767  ORF Transcript_8018/g.23767 Transcript_8018/m.23767 type:complete len:341 (+) Transcript_8018:910-1932(+)
MHVEEDLVIPGNEAEDRVVRGPAQRTRRRVEQPFQGREGDAVASQREADEGVVPPGRVVDDGEEAQRRRRVDGVRGHRRVINVVARLDARCVGRDVDRGEGSERRRTFQDRRLDVPPAEAAVAGPVADQIRPRVGHDPVGDAHHRHAPVEFAERARPRPPIYARGVRPQERGLGRGAPEAREALGRGRDGPPQLQALLRVPEAAQGVEAIRVSPERQVMSRRPAPEQRRLRVGARERIVAARLDVDVRAGPVGRRRRTAPRREREPGRAEADDRQIPALVVERAHDARVAEEVPVIVRVVVADARRRRAVGATPYRSDHGAAEDEPHGCPSMARCIDGVV